MAIDQGGAVLDNQDAAPKKDEYKNWIKMTHEEMISAQKNGTLMGYHPAKGLGLVNQDHKPVIKQEEKKK